MSLFLPPFHLAAAALAEQRLSLAAFAQSVIVLCNIASGARFPIVTGKQLETVSELMSRAPSRLWLCLIALLLPLGLGACADTVSSGETTSSATLQRQYDNTLTQTERKAVISDLQSATAKQKSPETEN